jgi:hypothetical protein
MEVAKAARSAYSVESQTPWIGKNRATNNYIDALRTIVHLQERRLEIGLAPNNDALREVDDVKAELTRLDNAERS